eukprot:199782_1
MMQQNEGFIIWTARDIIAIGTASAIKAALIDRHGCLQSSWLSYVRSIYITNHIHANSHSNQNEGVVEFQEKGDWDYMIRVKLDSHYVRVVLFDYVVTLH